MLTAITNVAMPLATTSALANAWPLMCQRSRISFRCSAGSMGVPTSPGKFAGRDLALVALDAGDATVGQRDHAVGHARDHRVVRDDGRGRAQFAIDVFDRLQHRDAGLYIQR